MEQKCWTCGAVHERGCRQGEITAMRNGLRALRDKLLAIHFNTSSDTPDPFDVGKANGIASSAIDDIDELLKA